MAGVEMRARRLVALCDVLGFREFVSREDLGALVERYRALLARTDYETRLSMTRFAPGTEETLRFEVEREVFSDTILLWSPTLEAASDEDLVNASVFLTVVSRLVGSGIVAALPLRIGVAYGECFIDPEAHIYVGQAVVDAYVTEQRQDWIGAACHRTCLETPFGSDLALLSETYQVLGGMIEGDIPVKKKPEGPALSYTLDWPHFIPRGVHRRQLEHLLEHGRKAFAYDRRKSRKWSRALRFFKERRRAHESGRFSPGGMLLEVLRRFEEGGPEERAGFLEALSQMKAAIDAVARTQQDAE
jgi:hypothetical protein